VTVPVFLFSLDGAAVRHCLPAKAFDNGVLGRVPNQLATKHAKYAWWDMVKGGFFPGRCYCAFGEGHKFQTQAGTHRPFGSMKKTAISVQGSNRLFFATASYGHETE
jgi:hypothetical protein